MKFAPSNILAFLPGITVFIAIEPKMEDETMVSNNVSVNDAILVSHKSDTKCKNLSIYIQFQKLTLFFFFFFKIWLRISEMLAPNK